MDLTRREYLAVAAALAATPLVAAPRAALGARPTPLADNFLLPEGGPANARVIQPPPAQLVTGGKIRAGVFAQPPGDANLLDADLFRGPQAWWRRTRLMEWFGYGITTPDWYFGTIIINAKLLPIASLYAVNRRDRTTFSHTLSAGRVSIARNPWHDRTWAKGPGYRVEFILDLAAGRSELVIDVRRPRRPRVRGRITLTEDMQALPSLSLTVPTAPPHFFYTHKACLPAGGELTVGDEKISLDPARDLAILDEHRNYAQAPARWTWGTAGGRDAEGRFLAFNLGDTGGLDQEHWNENCLWTGERIELLGPVGWTHDRRDPRRPWSVKEWHGRADLTFTPDNGKVVSVPGLGKYYQMAGYYSGSVTDAAGRKLEVKNFYGCAESGAVG